MSSPKYFRTIEEQIELLKTRNLKFKDEHNAYYVLRNITYYSLINGYKDFFIKEKTNEDEEDDYQANFFEDLHDVYDFDKELKNILFKYILNIEGTFNNALSYTISKNYGYLESEYLNVNKYNRGNKLRNGLYQNEHTIKVIEEKNESTDQPMKHYREKHGDVPPWVVCGSLSLSTKKYLYGLLRPVKDVSLKLEVVKWFLFYKEKGNPEIPIKTFNYAIDMVHCYRNEIAHNKRVIHFEPNYDQVKPLDKHSFCSYVNGRVYNKKMFEKKIGHRDLLGLFMSLTILFTHRNTVRSRFINEIRTIFTKLAEKNYKVYQLILKNNNIPENFLDILDDLVSQYNKK
ncbi:abortive infection bacteriophage resistance protein [Salinicoccus roseus]|nr:abortive infection bacteriophage resistance protein [Salinicoccus roseus]